MSHRKVSFDLDLSSLRRPSYGALFTALLISTVSVMADQPHFKMRPITDSLVEPQIIGGRKADAAFWPNTFVFRSPEGDQCTSTLVGSRVVLTAAHCVSDDAVGTIRVGAKTARVTCEHHPDYDGTVAWDVPGSAAALSPDWALCLLDGATSLTGFERIDARGDLLSVGRGIRLLGFGCNEKGGSDNGFGVLFEGDSTIDELASPPSLWTVTYGGAALCFGDSGGGAFLLLNENGTRRLLMGVNSRGDIDQESLVSTTSTPSFTAWARGWADAAGVQICGLDEDANDCRPQ